MRIKEFFSNLIHDRPFRWYFLAGVSFVFSLAFTAYNFIVGVLYNLVWNLSASVYYLMLMAIKAIILRSEIRWKDRSLEQIALNRLKLFKTENLFLLLIDIAMIAPITLMVLQQKNTVNIGMIPAIAVAGYTTYRVIMACVNYHRSKNSNNLALHGLKIISLKEAIVSIITLQNTMVVVFGDMSEMFTLTACTNAGMLLSMIALSIVQYIKLIKLTKQNKR